MFIMDPRFRGDAKEIIVTACIKRSRKIFKRFVLFLLFIISLSLPAIPSRAQQAPVIIRDTEIEAIFKEWMMPLLKAAGLGENGVHLVLVQSDDINAFVAGGANLFVYTGLIDKTDNPGELIGVLTHEMGHIAGGHLIGAREAMERASYESILGTVLGLGTALATGQSGAASAIMSGGNNIAQRQLMAHSRANESSADQAALRFMEGAGINPSGLGTFLEKIESEELLPGDEQSQYMRTHPLTQDRLDAVESKIQVSAYKDAPLPEKWRDEHARMKAKLLGFINPGRVPWVYDDRDQSLPARYARAIAAYRQNNIEPALQGIDALIKEEPSNPYFQELKAQMLRDFGRVAESIPWYRKALALKPDSGLIRIDLGHALLESGNDKDLPDAVNNLERGLQDEPRSAMAQRLLATAYGKMGQETKARLHLAEEAVMQRNLPYARSQAEGVLKVSAPGSREAIEARDILSEVENIQKSKD